MSSDDLLSLATDRGIVPMQVGAVLILGTGLESDPAGLIAAIARRVPAIPRLRQRLVNPGILLGRPIWTDDPMFRLENHVSVAPLGSRDMGDVLEIAADLIGARLSMRHPLWAAVIVPALDDGRTGLVIVFHHVLADGIAALAILGALTDDSVDIPGPVFPRPVPTTWDLALDAAQGRLVGVARIPKTTRRLAQALGQLTPSMRRRAPRCSLNQPIRGRQQFVTVDCDLAAARDVAHSHSATINDVAMSAIAGALRHLLEERGEVVNEFVISVMFSSRRTASAGSLGNQSGAVPLRIPASGGALDRLTAIAGVTKAEKLAARAASTAVLGPVFRALARMGVYQRFVDHQRFVNTFVTNMKGPPNLLTLSGFPITDIVPLTVTSGNVTVLFALLSYRGRLIITIVSDETTCPDVDRLRAALTREIDTLLER